MTSGLLGYTLRRVLTGVLLLLAVSALTFGLFFLLPGDPAAASAPRRATPEMLAQVRVRMGLDQPVWKQYLNFLHGPDRVGAGRPSGLLNWPPNLGWSFKRSEPVMDIVLDRLPVSLSLAVGSAVVWLGLGISAGVVAALWPRTPLDRAASAFTLAGVSAPVFITGATLLYVFYFRLGWLPPPRYTPLTEDPVAWAGGLLLPWLTTGLGMAALYTRLTRANLLEVRGRDFVRTARAKGLPEGKVVARHMLRPTLLPLLTLLGLDLGTLIGGAVVTELLFGLPGIAYTTVQALVDLDLPVVVGVVLTSACLVIVCNLVVDVLHAVLDPRVTASRPS